MQNKQLYGVMIPRLKLLELASGLNNEISTHSLGQWLKAETDDQYVVLPRDFVVALMDVVDTLFLEEQVRALMSNWNFTEIRGTWL
jgi:hypothetical protein